MEQVVYDDFDYLLLQLKRKMKQKNSHALMVEQADSNNGILIMGFRTQMPKEFKIADTETISNIFWSERGPSKLFINAKKNVGITFQLLEIDTEEYGITESRVEIKRVLENIDGRIVLYDEGIKNNVLWFDYKSFAENIIVYNIIFLFEIEHGIVMGTFFCPFVDYDKWKSVILEMLGTIEKEEIDEGL